MRTRSSGRANSYSVHRPRITRVSVAALSADSREASTSEERAMANTAKVATPITAPAGSENRRTRGRNPVRAGSWLGWKLSTNPGMPIVRASTTVSWRGRIG